MRMMTVAVLAMVVLAAGACGDEDTAAPVTPTTPVDTGTANEAGTVREAAALETVQALVAAYNEREFAEAASFYTSDVWSDCGGEEALVSALAELREMERLEYEIVGIEEWDAAALSGKVATLVRDENGEEEPTDQSLAVPFAVEDGDVKVNGLFPAGARVYCE